MEQGRLAASHAFGLMNAHVASTLPFGIYTVPEISMVGPTEQKLTEQKVPFETCRARYRELARGQIIGDSRGILKIIFHRETKKLLAVHILGEGATELIHIGQAVIAATLGAIAGAVLVTVGHIVKARLEERFLKTELGTAPYEAYARRTPMLIPWPRPGR